MLKKTNKTKEKNQHPRTVSLVYFTVLVDLQGIQLFVCINDAAYRACLKV